MKGNRRTMFTRAAGLLIAVLMAVCAVPGQVQAAKASDYAAVFDAAWYADHNADVKNAYGTDQAKLLDHFINFGMREGRQGNAEFNLEAYRSRYADLRNAFGGDNIQYYLHYIKFGKAEGRIATGSGAAVQAAPQAQPTQPAQTQSAQTPAAQPAQATKTASNHNNWRSIPGTDHPSYEKAAAILDTLGWSVTKAFKYCASITYYGHGKADMPEEPSPGTRWFADFGFTNNKGNCYVMASMFYEFAKLCGYSPRQMSGQVPLRKGGLGPHSWVEIDIDGQTYVYDPDYTYGTKKNGFKIQYGQSGTWKYQNYSQMSE